MADWQEFEKNATSFLDKYFKDTNINFVNQGGSDSTTSDIKMYQQNNLIGTIEAKYIPSQSGQIVVLSDGSKFIFSNGSKNTINDNTNIIIEHINNNYNYYKNVKTAGLPINVKEEVLFNWVKETYKNKNVSWIVSSNQYNNLSKNTVLLIPLEEINQYFNISAVLRRKKSGTAHLAVSSETLFIEKLKDIVNEEDYELSCDGKKYLLKLKKELDSKYISEEYFLSNTNVENEFYVKKRSGTNNPNIVFSLNYKNGLDFKDEKFKEYFHL
jgi:hypothetical protein